MKLPILPTWQILIPWAQPVESLAAPGGTGGLPWNVALEKSDQVRFGSNNIVKAGKITRNAFEDFNGRNAEIKVAALAEKLNAIGQTVWRGNTIIRINKHNDLTASMAETKVPAGAGARFPRLTPN